MDGVEGPDRLRRKRPTGTVLDLGADVEDDPVLGGAGQDRSPLGRHGLGESVDGDRTDQRSITLDQGEGRGKDQLGCAQRPSDLGGPRFIE